MQFWWRESCNLKIARVNQVRFSVQFVAAISQGFRTCLKLDATSARQKLHRVAATKIACVNGPLGIQDRDTEEKSQPDVLFGLYGDGDDDDDDDDDDDFILRG